MGISYTDKISTSEIIQLTVEGIEQLESYFGRYLPQLFYSIAAPITLFAVIYFIYPVSAVILLLCVPLIPVSIILVMKYAGKIFRRYWGQYVDLGEDFLDNIQGLTTLKIYEADEYKNNSMNKTAEKFRVITMKVLRMQLNSVSMMDLIAYGGSAAGIISAVIGFAAGNISLWGVFAIIMLSSEFFIPLRLLGSLFHIAMNGMSASDRMFEILDIKKQENKKGKYEKGDITVKDLSFSYDAERKILSNINMEIPMGSFVSLVGQSGSGKSTIAALLMGINKNYSGSITIGETELSSISEKEIMSNTTLISHNSYIFKGTVKDNLMLGKKDADDEDMKDVLKKVNLYDFIMANGGLESELAEQGSNLSGGQRQRLSLARALLHDSDIYIFDEATSNIDSESEKNIMAVIHRLYGIKTIVLISHRLENVKESDMIYVLDKGSIVEKGIHNELVENEGYYAELYGSQKNIEEYAKGEAVYA
jgi:ABC-type transport system involved in cytochrome bd biosynthesis fused ATPase/permease subunit